MTDRNELIKELLEERLRAWIHAEGDARSTLAGAIVVLEKLRGNCPLTDADVFTRDGQLIGGRGQALFTLLERHGVPEALLRDGVTTRSTEKFRRLLQTMEYGTPLAHLDPQQRDDLLNRLVGIVREVIGQWFARQNIKVACDRRYSPLYLADQRRFAPLTPRCYSR